jgi:hypothetical protein
MPRRPERRWPGLAAGYAVFVALLAAATAPIAHLVEAAHRPLVIRLAGALLLAVIASHLAKHARARIEAQPASEFDQALRPSRPEPRLDARFIQLREHLSHSARDDRYFRRVLWPALVALAERPPHASLRRPLVRPAGRLFGRGPSLAALRQAISSMETRT